MTAHKLFHDQPDQVILTSASTSTSTSMSASPDHDREGYRTSSVKRRQHLSPERPPDHYSPASHRYIPPRPGVIDQPFHVEQGSSRSVPAEDSLTVRRREANRLAAQRFRNRKKGYQDSLEERIRQLEEEKDAMSRRLGESGAEPYVDGEDKGWTRGDRPSFSHSLTPEREGEGDVRLAALESANRRLRDEVRDLGDENARLREDLEGWRRWSQDIRGREERVSGRLA